MRVCGDNGMFLMRNLCCFNLGLLGIALTLDMMVFVLISNYYVACSHLVGCL